MHLTTRVHMALIAAALLVAALLPAGAAMAAGHTLCLFMAHAISAHHGLFLGWCAGIAAGVSLALVLAVALYALVNLLLVRVFGLSLIEAIIMGFAVMLGLVFSA